MYSVEEASSERRAFRAKAKHRLLLTGLDALSGASPSFRIAPILLPTSSITQDRAQVVAARSPPVDRNEDITSLLQLLAFTTLMVLMSPVIGVGLFFIIDGN